MILNQKEIKTGASFIELNENEEITGNTNKNIEANFYNKSDKFISDEIINNDGNNENELNRIVKLEKMIQSLDGNIKNMNQELHMIKSSLFKKQNKNKTPPNTKTENIYERINSNQNDKNVKNTNVLKMKTFNDLELDLNLLKSNDNKYNKSKYNNSGNIRQEDFVKNLLKMEINENLRNKKTNGKIDSDFADENNSKLKEQQFKVFLLIYF